MHVKTKLAIGLLAALTYGTDVKADDRIPLDGGFISTRLTGQSGFEMTNISTKLVVESVEFIAGDCGNEAFASLPLPATLHRGDTLSVLSTKPCRLIAIGVSTSEGDFIFERD